MVVVIVVVVAGIFLGNVGDQRLGGEQQSRHTRAVLQSRANYLGRVEVNEQTCVGCKLCEEVCGWEGIYIMPGRDKEPFLEALGYDEEAEAS